jgi:tetratricopeptide (TPR) repeat protein
LSALLKEIPYPPLKEILAQSYLNLSDIAKLQGRIDAAVNYCHLSIKIKHDQARADQRFEHHKDLADEWLRIGRLVMVQGYHELAEKYFKKAISIAVPLAKEGFNPDHYLRVEVIYSMTGDALCHQQNFREALAFHHKALQIAEAVMRKAPTPRSRFAVCLAHDKLAQTLIGLAEFGKSSAELAKALATLEDLIQEFPCETYRECYRVFLEHVAVALENYIGPRAGSEFREKAAGLHQFKPDDMRILTPPNADDLEWMLAEYAQRLVSPKPKCGFLSSEAKKYAVLYSSIRNAVQIALDKDGEKDA